MSTVFKNKGPIYTTRAKHEAMRIAGTLVVGQEYKIIDWEAQEKLTSGSNIKTINGETLLGSGNVAIKTYQAFPNGSIEGTLAEIVEAIFNFPSKAAGMGYLGGIEGAGTPFGYGNAECKVEFMTDDIALLTVSSSNISPYHWEYNTAQGDYKWRGAAVLPDMPTYSAEKSYQLSLSPDTSTSSWKMEWTESGSGTEGVTDVLVNGTSVVTDNEAFVNIKTINTIEVAGTGNITIEGVPVRPSFDPSKPKSYMLMCVPNSEGTAFEFKWAEISAGDSTDNNNNGIPDEDEDDETLPASAFFN